MHKNESGRDKAEGLEGLICDLQAKTDGGNARRRVFHRDSCG